MSQLELEEVWATLHEPLLHFVRRRVRDSAVAEDIVQDVFVTMTSRLHTLRQPERVHGWAYQITRRAIADYYRARTTEPLPENVAAPANDADDLRAVVGRCLHGLLAALPPSSREALLLTDVQGVSQRELAERLGLSFSGAKARVQRARARLRALLLSCCTVRLDQHGSPIGCEPRDPQCCATPCCAERCCTA